MYLFYDRCSGSERKGMDRMDRKTGTSERASESERERETERRKKVSWKRQFMIIWFLGKTGGHGTIACYKQPLGRNAASERTGI